MSWVVKSNPGLASLPGDSGIKAAVTEVDNEELNEDETMEITVFTEDGEVEETSGYFIHACMHVCPVGVTP